MGCKNSPSLSTRKKKVCPFNFKVTWGFVPSKIDKKWMTQHSEATNNNSDNWGNDNQWQSEWTILSHTVLKTFYDKDQALVSSHKRRPLTGGWKTSGTIGSWSITECLSLELTSVCCVNKTNVYTVVTFCIYWIIDYWTHIIITIGCQKHLRSCMMLLNRETEVPTKLTL